MTTPTMSEPDDRDNCHTCDENHVELANRGMVPKHPFNNGSVPFKTTFGAPRDRRDGKSSQRGAESPSTAPWPFDPVLRQALVDKGVLTPDDLRAAETKIKEMSVIFNQGGSGGVQAT
jgi:hypothetical protein